MRAWLSLGRRFVTVLAVGLWLGGFTLYTAVVIPIGHRQLSAGKFGFVTGEVTGVLNWLAVVAGLLLGVELGARWKRSGKVLRWGGALAWALGLLATAGLFVLHAQLDGLLDYRLREISDRPRFEVLHERYELVASLQWALGVIQLWMVLAGWRRADAARGDPGETPANPSLRS